MHFDIHYEGPAVMPKLVSLVEEIFLWHHVIVENSPNHVNLTGDTNLHEKFTEPCENDRNPPLRKLMHFRFHGNLLQTTDNWYR